MKYAALKVKGLNKPFNSLEQNEQDFVNKVNNWYDQNDKEQFDHLRNKDTWLFDLETETAAFCRTVFIAHTTNLDYEVIYFNDNASRYSTEKT